jgi:cytochrome c556
MRTFALGTHYWIAGAISVAVFAAGTLGIGSVALGQDQTAATAKDVIFARKVLMSSIGENMDDLDIMVETKKVDVAHGAMHADTISVMLLAFPHLFPPASNEWKPGVEKDAGVDTFASPDVWTRFADFYKRSADASKSAYNASKAQNADEFKKYAIELRVACDGCHAAYQKKD